MAEPTPPFDLSRPFESIPQWFRSRGPRTRLALALTAAIAAAAFVVGAVAILSNEDGPPAVRGTVVSYAAQDPAHLTVVVRLTNTTSRAVTAKCTVEATTPYGDLGLKELDEQLGPRETTTGNVYLIVQNTAANLVDRVAVDDC